MLMKSSEFIQMAKDEGLDISSIQLKIYTLLEMFPEPLFFSKDSGMNIRNGYYDSINLKRLKKIFELGEERKSIREIRNQLPVFEFILEDKGLVILEKDEKEEDEKELSKELLKELPKELLKEFKKFPSEMVAHWMVFALLIHVEWVQRFFQLHYFPKTLEERIVKIIGMSLTIWGWGNDRTEFEVCKKILEEIKKENSVENMKFDELSKLLHSAKCKYEELFSDAIEWIEIADPGSKIRSKKLLSIMMKKKYPSASGSRILLKDTKELLKQIWENILKVVAERLTKGF